MLSVWRMPLSAQNLDQIGKGEAFSLSGGVSTTQIVYAAQGLEQRRDPYSYFINGNLALSIYGLSMPFSFSYSNQNAAFQQPFNQYGLSPTYKGWTAHLGYRSMTFSPYTLNGHIFLGTGLEYQSTGAWKFSAMYGRLQKEVVYDSTQLDAQAAFRRMGYGLKTAYQKDRSLVEFVIFGAEDQMGTMNYLPTDNSLMPMQNLVIGLNASQTLGRVAIRGEYANSALVRDTRAKDFRPSVSNLQDYLTPIYQRKVSSSYYDALKLNATYQGAWFQVGLGYERIDPEYQTLGAYYFANDLENMKLNTAFRLFQQKLNVSVNTGLQKNNLKGDKSQEMERWVGAANLSYAASAKLNLSGSYSNFQTFTRIRSVFETLNQTTPYDNLDTLNYTQLAQSANLNANYMLAASKARSSSLSCMLSYQQSDDKQGETTLATGTQFYNGNASYTHTLNERNMGVTTSFNYNLQQGLGMNTSAWGPSFSINKALWEKKVKTAVTISYNEARDQGIRLSGITNLRFSGGYTYLKKHNFSLSLITLNRQSRAGEGLSLSTFNEFTGTLTYNYSF
ncbi:hypothetical protein QWY31_00115 [Cytophagales bacterium LB-30]|uniref:Uncharacterized protein n=1 Tax=Shiella aurantiaca TaxID=3058365 RepID=A0ABT8F0R9_9BACT|nr:hypothetical protein [Shiella aurantiaca]MDN4163878.1 hypothetical protein [Shiella aurantiaca]